MKSNDFPYIPGLVSILMCSYNAASTIEKTIDSCLGQNYPHFEILIHDDASTDNTLQIIHNIHDQRIKLIRSGKKLGPYAGLNLLLGHAQGEYIAIQDHDDLWHKDKLKSQIDFLEQHKRYMGCGTKTLMRYEGDQKGFEYYLGNESYYTIHPSLVFRNGIMRYPTDTSYMVDAYFQKKELCKGGNKLIYNINKTLTLHLVKSGASNYSYKRFSYSMATLRSLFYLHPIWYGVCILGRETLRKLLYPLLHRFGKGNWIDTMERFPFVILGNKMGEYGKDKIRGMGF